MLIDQKNPRISNLNFYESAFALYTYPTGFHVAETPPGSPDSRVSQEDVKFNHHLVL